MSERTIQVPIVEDKSPQDKIIDEKIIKASTEDKIRAIDSFISTGEQEIKSSQDDRSLLKLDLDKLQAIKEKINKGERLDEIEDLRVDQALKKYFLKAKEIAGELMGKPSDKKEPLTMPEAEATKEIKPLTVDSDLIKHVPEEVIAKGPEDVKEYLETHQLQSADLADTQSEVSPEKAKNIELIDNCIEIITYYLKELSAEFNPQQLAALQRFQIKLERKKQEIEFAQSRDTTITFDTDTERILFQRIVSG